MIEVVGIVLIVFGVLQIILFFKIWGMTNDIRELKSFLNWNLQNSLKDIIKELEKIRKGEK